MKKKLKCKICGRKIASKFMSFHVKSKHNSVTSQEAKPVVSEDITREKLINLRNTYTDRLHAIDLVLSEIDKW